MAASSTAAAAFKFTSVPPVSLYVHLPWCVQKCPYCDFNSYALKDRLPEHSYVQALLDHGQHAFTQLDGQSVENLFIGGGTPSLFSPEALERLLTGLHARLRWNPRSEITMEANPGTVEQAKFKEFRSLGINRLSIGVQSFSDVMLTRLGRIHDGRSALRAVETAHEAGFENVNIDLMYGLPTQDPAASLADLRTAIALAPTHISFYQLTIEPNTRFCVHRPRLPDDDAIWQMQQHGQQILADHGYTQYEVSAFAREPWRCKHNLNYWMFGDYLGIGAGAHGKLTSLTKQRIYRYENFKQPRQYMSNTKIGRFRSHLRQLSPADALFEFMLNALRLRDGVPVSLVVKRTGLSRESIVTSLIPARNDGLLVTRKDWVKPSELGQRFLNDLLLRLLPTNREANHECFD